MFKLGEFYVCRYKSGHEEIIEIVKVDNDFLEYRKLSDKHPYTYMHTISFAASIFTLYKNKINCPEYLKK